MLLIEQEAEWFQRQFGYCGEEKNAVPLPGIEPYFFYCPAHSLLAALTQLFLLSKQHSVSQFLSKRHHSALQK
jgi:hypothetical protein